jgi:hypothetical protein
MELIERTLLDAVARDREDRETLAVLADYWIEHVDPARGAYVQLHCGDADGRADLADEEARLGAAAAGWRAPAVAAGYPERDLVFDRGILQWPLSVFAGEPLDERAELFRLSPRYYRIARCVQRNPDFEVFVADEVTPMRARFTRRDRVVLKAVAETADDIAHALIEREHAILLRLQHPNVVSTLGFAVTRHGRALATRWAGIGLDVLVRNTNAAGRRLGVELALSVAVQLCDALEAAHRAGVIHREVRTDHVLVAEDGTVTLIDFAEVAAAEPSPGQRWLSPGPRRDDMFGYLSPEQCMGHKLDARADLFSAALITCELMTGVHPVRERANTFDLLVALRDCRLVLPAMPAPVEAVLRRTLVPREQRLTSAGELRDALVHAARRAGLALGPDVIARALCALGVAA